MANQPGLFHDRLLGVLNFGPSGEGVDFGTAVPSTSFVNYVKGSIRINNNPTALGPAGWICTVAGAPGTWVPFGAAVEAVGGALASAATIAPTSPVHHVTGTTTIQTITPPTPFTVSGVGGRVRLIFDGVAPWNALGNIFVAGTSTTAGTFVDFEYDPATSKWYPSRVA